MAHRKAWQEYNDLLPGLCAIHLIGSGTDTPDSLLGSETTQSRMLLLASVVIEVPNVLAC